jgi:hypothetical protein
MELRTVFGDADELVVSDNLDRAITTIRDPLRIGAALDLLVELDGEWHVPVDGVPVAAMRFNFRRDGVGIGNVGVGGSFVTAHVDGGFTSRDSVPQLLQRLLTATGTSPSTTRVQGGRSLPTPPDFRKRDPE